MLYLIRKKENQFGIEVDNIKAAIKESVRESFFYLEKKQQETGEKSMKEHSIKEYRTFLMKSPLFKNIGAAELEPLLNCLGAYVANYKKGDFISLTGQKLRCIGVVMKGSVHMIKEDVWGNKALFSIMGEQDIFGESFVFANSFAATVSFYSATDCEVLFLDFDSMMQTCGLTCSFHHSLIENMVTLIAEKNIRLMEKLEITSKKSLREKILTYLSQQSIHNNSHYFTSPLGRGDLAEFLCADRSALTRELSKMKEEGLLDYDKNTFKLLN